ncbi:MAG: hypothetical protein ACMUIL_05035 [bacterium]
MYKKVQEILIVCIIFSVLVFLTVLSPSPGAAQLSGITFNPLVSTLAPLTSWGYQSWGPGSPLFRFNPFGYGFNTGSLYSSFNPLAARFSLPFSFPGGFSGLTSLTLPQVPFSLPMLSPVSLSQASLSLAAPLPMRMAAQAGTWIGTWQSTFVAFIILFNSGTMTMTLVENPTLNTISGTCILEGSRFANTLFDVQGALTGTPLFELQGVIGAGGFTVVMSCTLTSPTTMTGTYSESIGFGGPVVDRGVFSLTLI